MTSSTYDVNLFLLVTCDVTITYQDVYSLADIIRTIHIFSRISSAWKPSSDPKENRFTPPLRHRIYT